MRNWHLCRTLGLPVAVAMALTASCTRQQAPVNQPPVPSADAATAAEFPATPSDTARLRQFDRAGVPDPGSTVACATTGRVRLDADSVALRFTAAFMKAGILPIRLSLPSVDGVIAGPADVAVPAPARIAARAGTETRGDSTWYRVEFRVAPPPQGWTAGDSAVAAAHAAGSCDQVVKLAFPAA